MALFATAHAASGRAEPVRRGAHDRSRIRRGRLGTRVVSANRWVAARKLLCVRLDNLGDVLMTTPALRALKERAPSRRITLLASTVGAEAAAFIPEIDETMTYRAPWMKTAPVADAAAGRQFIGELQRRRFDAAIIFTVYSQ